MENIMFLQTELLVVWGVNIIMAILLIAQIIGLILLGVSFIHICSTEIGRAHV